MDKQWINKSYRAPLYSLIAMDIDEYDRENRRLHDVAVKLFKGIGSIPTDPKELGYCVYHACIHRELQHLIPSLIESGTKILINDDHVQDIIHDLGSADDTWAIDIFLKHVAPNQVAGKRLDIYLIEGKYYNIFDRLITMLEYVPCRETYDIFQNQVRSLDLMREKLLDMLLIPSSKRPIIESDSSRKRSRYDID